MTLIKATKYACIFIAISLLIFIGLIAIDLQPTQKKEKSVADYHKGCELGSMEDCSMLGSLYYYGIGVAKDFAAASEYYKKACQRREPEACRRLGYMYGSGDGVDKDIEMEFTLYQKACYGGDEGGCRLVKDMKFQKRLDKLLVSVMHQACNAGNPKACFELGVTYDEGVLVERNTSQATELFNQACNLGRPDACERYKDNN